MGRFHDVPEFSSQPRLTQTPLNVHILTLIYTKFFPGVIVLYNPVGIFRLQWELLLWSCLMPPAFVTTGDPVICILGWIAKRKSGSGHTMTSGTIDFTFLWFYRFHILLDPLTSSATTQSGYINYINSWSNRLHLLLDHWTSPPFGFIDSWTQRFSLIFYNYHIGPSQEEESSSVVLPEVSPFSLFSIFFQVSPPPRLENMRAEGITSVQFVKALKCTDEIWFDLIQ